MPKSQESWNKKEKEKLRQKKKEEKAQRKEVRKSHASDGSLDSMLAYVDEYGNISSTPPDVTKRRNVISAEQIEIGVPKRKEETEAEKTRTGVVTFFNESKGFGFIKDISSQESIFTHIKGHVDQIRESDRVTFQVEQGHKGLNAFDVRLVK